MIEIHQYLFKNLGLCRIMTYLGVMILLWLTLQPVHQTWGQSDLSLSYISIIIAFGAGLSSILSKQSFRFVSIDLIAILWYLYTMGYAYLQPNYPVASTCLRGTQLFALYFSLRLLFQINPIKSDYIAIGLILCSLLEIYLGVSQIFSGISRHTKYILTGSFFNPGPYGIYVALGIVLLVKLYLQHRDRLLTMKWKNPIKIMGGTVLSVQILLLLLSWSRTAIMTVGILLILLYYLHFKKNLWQLIIVLIVSSIGFYFIKQGSANGRLLIIWVSMHLFSAYPILGTGIGSFFHSYAEEMAIMSKNVPDGTFTNAGVLDYAFNTPLRILVEQGAIGFLMGGIFILAILKLFTKRGNMVKWGLLLLLLSSLSSYPFALQPFQIIFILITAHLVSSRLPINTHTTIYISRYIPMMSCFVMGLLLLVTPHIEKRVKIIDDYNRFSITMNERFIEDYYWMLPLMEDNTQFLFDFANSLYKAQRFKDSNAILRKGALISNDPIFYILQGNNYKAMGEIALAEKQYQKAFDIMPNRLYPLYQLMILYKESGQTNSSIDMAKRVINFPVKISSPATTDMKTEAYKILSQGVESDKNIHYEISA